MADEKHRYDPPTLPPIPSYEEATSSRHVPTARRGPNEASDDAERQGLLTPDAHVPPPPPADSRRRNGYYHPPSVQSVDDGDSEPPSPSDADHDDDDMRHTIMEEMDMLDPEAADDASRRRRPRGRLSKRWHRFAHKVSRFHARMRWPRLPWPRRSSFAFFTQRMPAIPDEYKPGWSIFARLGGLMLIITLVYLLVVSDVVPMGGGFGAQFNPEWIRQKAQQNVEGWRIQQNLEYIASYDHLAGTKGSFALGSWIEDQFKAAHMDAYAHDEYRVYMNYPKDGGRRVAIVEPADKAWEAKLEEPDVYNPAKAQTLAFHAMSASGNVTGPLIYVNYCDKKDFKRLWDSSVDVQGAVVLCRYYGTQPDLAMKVKAAQDAGVAGVLVYSDPAEDGFKRGSTWPDGKWRPRDSVQRGSVAMSNMILGDVLTPGRGSTKKEGRISKDKNPALPTIPSLPLSWKNAQKLLKSLNGIGEALPEEWTGGVPDVGDKWYSGHPAKSPKVNLQNHQDEVEQQPIMNVFGRFLGVEDTDRKIIIGNHRDSFCFGAADPGSGTAIMLEVAKVLGELRVQGWRPLRTIEFASWDAGEYNRMGSTEHVEANIHDLHSNAMAYLNVDAAVTGDKLWANGSPLFNTAWTRILDRILDPHNDNQTLKETWEMQGGTIGNLGAGSDYAPFQFLAGTSSLDFGFTSANSKHANTMAHSCYETYEWMSKYIDPGFMYHQMLAQLWVLLILELAQEPIVPLKLDDYARHLQDETQALLDWTEQAGASYDIAIFQPLVDALGAFKAKADEFHKWELMWYNQLRATGGFETQAVTMQRVGHNARMARFETMLLDMPEGDKDKRPHGVCIAFRISLPSIPFPPSLPLNLKRPPR